MFDSLTSKKLPPTAMTVDVFAAAAHGGDVQSFTECVDQLSIE